MSEEKKVEETPKAEKEVKATAAKTKNVAPIEDFDWEALEQKRLQHKR